MRNITFIITPVICAILSALVTASLLEGWGSEELSRFGDMAENTWECIAVHSASAMDAVSDLINR